MTVWYAG